MLEAPPDFRMFMHINTLIEVTARLTDVMKNTIKSTLLEALFRCSLYSVKSYKEEGDNLVWLSVLVMPRGQERVRKRLSEEIYGKKNYVYSFHF